MDLQQYLDPQIIASLQAGGYILMLVLMIIEGPIVTFIGAFLASLGVFDIWLVWILAWMGDIVGDLFFYSIGYYGWHIFENKTTVDAPKESSLIQKLDHLIKTNLALAILVIKFTPYAPPIGLTYIGKMHINIKKYLSYSLILCIPIPLVCVLVGYHIGIINTLLARYTGITLILYLLGALGTICFALGIFLFTRKKSAEILEGKKTIFGKIEKNTKAENKAEKKR